MENVQGAHLHSSHRQREAVSATCSKHAQTQTLFTCSLCTTGAKATLTTATSPKLWHVMLLHRTARPDNMPVGNLAPVFLQ